MRKETRTKTQRQADSFDLKLFRLISDALAMAEQAKVDTKWGRVARALSAARPDVRTMMHPDDRKETM